MQSHRENEIVHPTPRGSFLSGSPGSTRYRIGAEMTFDLVSPLPPNECVRRLRAATDGMWSLAGSKSAQGAVSDKAIRLRKRIFYRNSFQCWLSAKLVGEYGQTRLHCSFGLHPFVRIFLEIWIAIVSVVGLTIAMQTTWLWLRSSPLSPNAWLGIVFPLIMVVLPPCS
jgi:hypothetical protein